MTKDVLQQLNSWKALALDKQKLIKTAVSTLGLNENCTPQEIKLALEEAITKGNQADSTVEKIKAETKLETIKMQRVVASTEAKYQQEKEQKESHMRSAEEAEHRMLAGKEANAVALKKASQQREELQKKIKETKTILADTPENVMKRMRKLQREKFDEAELRKQHETEVRKLKKEVKALKTEVKEANTKLDSAKELASNYKETHSVCDALYQAAKSSGAKDLAKIPPINEKALAVIDPQKEE